MDSAAASPSHIAEAERIQRSVTMLEEQQLAHQFESMSRRTRKRRMVLFFGRPTFSDNTKYLYLRSLAHERNYEVMWCSFEAELVESLSRRGLPALCLADDIDRSIDLLMHAAVAVFCVNPNESLKGSFSLNACLAGSAKLQLWHGVSVKHLLLRLIPHLGVRDMAVRRAFYMASQADHVLSTASTFDNFWRECFGCRQLVRAGLPRNEVLVRPASELEMLGAELSPEVEAGMACDRKNVLVVPTWQRGQQTYLNESEFFGKVMAYGRGNKVNFFFKMHPTYFLQNLDTRKKSEGFYLLNPGTDVYPLMHRFDALITDYSSIMFDFLLTGKPVLGLDFSPGDHHRFEPDFSLVPDVDYRHRFTAENFEKQLKTALYEDQLAPRRQEMLSRIFETDPGLACDQLLNLVDRLVDSVVKTDDYSVDDCGR